MPVPLPVGQAVTAAHEDAKGCFLYIKHRRRHVIDLPRNFDSLKRQVNSLLMHWNVVNDDINRQSATIWINDNYTARYDDLCQVWIDYQENFVKKYKRIVGLESDAMGEAGNQILVHELLAASKGWKNKFCTPTFYKLARLDKDVVKFMTEVSNLENKITLEHVTSPINPQIVVRQGAKELTDMPSHHELLVELQLCLYVAGCRRIAIHGAPQVGKTNILKSLNNLLVRRLPGLEFDYVIWVTFPTDLPKPDDIVNIVQEKILDRLNLSGQKGTSGKKEVISRALREKSYLLLFDGFSSSIELEDIGISEEHELGKVIIEAKDPHLLRNFKFHTEIHLEKLPPEDSRKLFDKIIADEIFCKENRDLGDLILKELGGLPGVIASTAGQLKTDKRVQYWDGVKQRLKADIWDNNLVGLAGVKSAFDTAYSKLKENDRKCILYAALFPKDFSIPIDILVECWKAEEFLWCPIPTVSHARREGACVLKQLIELNLLEKCFEHHVKMPIIYRRLALETSFPGEKNATSFVRSGPEIDGHLKDEEWEMARRVSLIQSQLEELPASPKCEGMSTLFLQLNPNLRIIEEPFFRRMQNLRVLDLHSTGIKLLPPSISYLTSLWSLYLNNCCDLTVLPPEIVKLKQLEVLDIRSTSIHCLPEEISSLFGLRCLRFSFVLEACNPNPEPERTWLIFSPGTADQLNKLEELTIVLVNGSSEGLVGQIETEVLEFKNKNNQFKLILHRPSQSVDQGNLVQRKGKGVYLPNPSVSASHVHDPTTGNYPSVRASYVHGPTTGNQSPRSDNKKPHLRFRKGVYLANPSVSASYVHDPTTGNHPSVPVTRVHDPTTGNHPSVRASHVHDPTTGNQSRRSDNKRDKGQKEINPNSGSQRENKWTGMGHSGRDTAGGLCSNPNTIPPNITPAKAAWLRSLYADSGDKEQRKHAIAVAAATAAAADADAAVAAARAAVAMVRLTSQGRGGTMFDGGGSREKWAVTKIQSVFRGFLARKALRALKGLVKLQALARGYLVRKRAFATFHSMQALIRAQANVRAQKTRSCLDSAAASSNRQFHAANSAEKFDEGRSRQNSFHNRRLSASFDSIGNR